MKKYGIIGLTAAMAAGMFGYWAWINSRLMPEVVHTAADIVAANRLFRMAPPLAVALLVAGLGLTALGWRRQRGWLFRSMSLIPLAGLAFGVVLSRSTVVEMMMFSPVEEARFVDASAASFVEPEHLVLGVATQGQAKAYPIRMVAYHHIVNDQLAGEPYVVTY